MMDSPEFTTASFMRRSFLSPTSTVMDYSDDDEYEDGESILQQAFRSPRPTNSIFIPEAVSSPPGWISRTMEMDFTSATLPRASFRSPNDSMSIFINEELRPPDASFMVATGSKRKKKKPDGPTEFRPVLPRLWDKVCATVIDKSFAKKKLFSQPRKKLLLPLIDEEECARKSQREDEVYSCIQLIDPELSPVSRILKAAKSWMPKSPEHRNDDEFTDDSHMKWTPQIARSRIDRALKQQQARKQDAQRHQKQQVQRQQRMWPISQLVETQRDENQSTTSKRPEYQSQPMAWNNDKRKSALSTSTDSSPLVRGDIDSEWSP